MHPRRGSGSRCGEEVAMRGVRTGLILLLLAAGLLASARFTLRAQERKANAPKPTGVRASERVPTARYEEEAASTSVQDALQRPFTFPFATPTSLADVCQHLRQALK